MTERITMMQLRSAPGEVLERMRWNKEDFILTKQGRDVAYFISRERMELLLGLLPLNTFCNFCTVTIGSNSEVTHKENCPANFLHRLAAPERGDSK
jgi:hypothetical protein